MPSSQEKTELSQDQKEELAKANLLKVELENISKKEGDYKTEGYIKFFRDRQSDLGMSERKVYEAYRYSKKS